MCHPPQHHEKQITSDAEQTGGPPRSGRPHAARRVERRTQPGRHRGCPSTKQGLQGREETEEPTEALGQLTSWSCPLARQNGGLLMCMMHCIVYK